MIYLDYSATTPVDKRVLDKFYEVTKNYIGNPNSVHRLGKVAKKIVDESTKNISNILKVKPSEIIYTSGATESNNTVIKGICFKHVDIGKHIITTKLEHASIVSSLNYLVTLGYEVDFVNLMSDGTVDLEHLEKLLRNDTVLVTICSVNSEIGIKQPISKIANIVHKNSNAFFHSDMTQSIGKELVDLNDIDLASISAQKFYGMKGAGLLVKKENVSILPLLHGGKSTTNFRSGTPSTALIASISKALTLSYENFDNKFKYITELNNFLRGELNKISIVHINSPGGSIPHILNISVLNINRDKLQSLLSEKEIYLSTGTACSMSDISSSVLELTKNEEYARHSIRISLSHLTTKEELINFVKELKDIIEVEK